MRCFIYSEIVVCGFWRRLTHISFIVRNFSGMRGIVISFEIIIIRTNSISWAGITNISLDFSQNLVTEVKKTTVSRSAITTFFVWVWGIPDQNTDTPTLKSFLFQSSSESGTERCASLRSNLHIKMFFRSILSDWKLSILKWM